MVACGTLAGVMMDTDVTVGESVSTLVTVVVTLNISDTPAARAGSIGES